MLERNGELTDARRALLRDMERYAAASAAGTSAWSATSARRYDEGRLRRVRLLPRRARGGRRSGRRSRARSCRRGARRAALRRRPRRPTCCAAATASSVARAGHDALEHVRPAARDVDRRECAATSSSSSRTGCCGRPTSSIRCCADRRRRRAAARTGGAPDLTLARQRKPEKGRGPSADRAPRPSHGRASIATLFERLRALRLEIAARRGVPPYVIFHDTTLREMARLKPTTIDGAAARLRRRRAQGRGSRGCGDRSDPGRRAGRGCGTGHPLVPFRLSASS